MPKTNVLDRNLDCKQNKLFFNGLSYSYKFDSEVLSSNKNLSSSIKQA